MKTVVKKGLLTLLHFVQYEAVVLKSLYIINFFHHRFIKLMEW